MGTIFRDKLNSTVFSLVDTDTKRHTEKFLEKQKPKKIGKIPKSVAEFI